MFTDFFLHRYSRFTIGLLVGLGFLGFLFFQKKENSQPTQHAAELIETELPKQAQPYEYFAQQRAWPRLALDAEAYQSAVTAARKVAVAQEKTFLSRGGATLNPWRLEGPTNIAGRVNTMALYPGSSDTLLAGFATGGIFRTTDGGINWTSVFDEAEWCAVGDIVHAPSNPEIVYASTGDPQLTGYTINGVGVFKSLDGGKTWNYAGFRNGGVLSTIVVHPSNPQILYVASMGNPFIRDAERGVYKSTDGGVTWSRMLGISTHAGCIDLVMHPQQPDVVYAAFWDRIRNNQESLLVGPNAKIFKTTDGGQSWNHLSNGLPSGNNCRIGLAISHTNPDKLYAVYCDSTYHLKGLYKSVNAGAAWTTESITGATNAYVGFGWYFGKVRLNPTNDEDVYIPGLVLYRKEPGQNSFYVAAGAHADIHELLVAPNGKRYLGSDGGPYYHIPGASPAWSHCKNLPTTQFYKIGQNPHQPTWYYGGAQDNGTVGGAGGNNLWYAYSSKDGFDCHFHPTNPDIFWMSSQNGEINLTLDRGWTWIYGNTCLGAGNRCSWNTPFFLSVHDPNRLYAGTSRVHTTYGLQGMSWGAISPDLTDGVIYGNAFHVVTCVAESPLQAEKLYAGTSDGNVWWRSVAGTWTNITAGLPDRYVTAVKGSPTFGNTIYVSHSGLRYNEDLSHLHRSDNNGQTWVSIAGNLPDLPINDFLVMPGHADTLLLVATDIGVYFSKNSGQQWARLGKDLPYVPVYEIEYNPLQNRVAVATFGRSIWSFPVDSIRFQPTQTFSIAGKVGCGLAEYGLVGIPGMFPGDFVVSGLQPGQSFTIEPIKNDDTRSGIDVNDLLAIQKHILGTNRIPSARRLIAADANGSRDISALDIVELRKLLLGYFDGTGFPNNKSWRFIPESYVFPNPLLPFQDTFPEKIVVQNLQSNMVGLDFRAIKIGDVDSSLSCYNPLQNPAVDSRGFEQHASVPVRVLDVFVKKGQRTTLLLDLPSNVEVEALQFCLSSPRGKFRIRGVRPRNTWFGAESYYWNEKENTVRVAAFTLKPTAQATAQTAQLEVVVEALQSGWLSDGLFFDEKKLLNLAITPAAERARLDLVFQNPVRDTPVTFAQVSKISVAPNPFVGEELRFVFPQPLVQKSTLELYRLDGTLAYSVALATGISDCRLDRAAFGGLTGVFVWKIGRESGKLVVL